MADPTRDPPHDMPPDPPRTPRRRFVLVLGTGFARPGQRDVARRIGQWLADEDFGLVTGNSTGIDQAVAAAFCAARRMRGEPLPGAFCQVSLGGWRFLRRGGWPLPGYAAPRACRIDVADVEDWKREAVARCDAAVMVGGGRGALDIARRVIAQGKPVFPLPFQGGLTGNADAAFREILRTWASVPVPGVTRTQYLRLAEPWLVGIGPLGDLLRGTLAERPDVFISYRRSDAPAAAGRLAADLGERFGTRRVFLDVQGIAPSHAWDRVIDEAVAAARVGLVVIGRSWLAPAAGGSAPRLHEAHDVVRREVAQLLAGGKAVFPLLVEGARLPEAAELPPALAPLLRLQALSFGNGDWEATLELLVREIDTALRAVPRAVAPDQASSDSSTTGGTAGAPASMR